MGMNKDLLKFFLCFTKPVRLNKALKDKTLRVLLGRRYLDNPNDFTVVGKLYISENNAYMVLSSWHLAGFHKLVEPYVSCTKLLTYQRADMDDEIITVYHITGIKSIDYVYDFK